MQVHVKTPHIKIDISGDIPESVIAVLKKEYGKKLLLSDDEEYVDAKDMEWYKKIKEKMTPGETMSIYRKLHKMTQSQLGEKLGGISKQNISHMEKGIHPISKKIAKELAALFQVSVEKFI